MIGRLRRRLRMFLHRDQFDRDLRDEMQLHAELRARKVGEDRAARIQFGNQTLLVEQSRDVWGWTRLESYLQDARFAARILRRNPVFTASAVLTLALGIGANAAIFALLNAMLFKPLPVSEPARLVRLVLHGDEIESNFCFPAFEEIDRSTRTLEGLFTWNATELSIGWGVDARRIEAAVASGAAYQTLGLKAVIGRLFTPEDDTLIAPPVAVISHSFWETEFHRDPQVIGRTILLDRQRFMIVGVTPASFRSISVGHAPQVTIPIHANAQLHPQWDILHTKRTWWLSILGRRKPGVSEAQVNADMSTISRQVVAAANPGVSAEDEREFFNRKLEALPAARGVTLITERYHRPLLVMIAISALVLLIACVNLANLLLARAAAREREMSLRLALGASRSRLIRQAITESALLLAMGTTLGIAFALWSTGAAARLLSLELDLRPDMRVIGFLSAIAIGAGVVFALAPAIRGTGLDAHDALKQVRIGTGTGRWGGGRDLLIVGQIAISLMLLIGALLFTRTFANLRSQDAGFTRGNLVFVELNTERAGMSPAQLASFYEKLLADLRVLPLVRSASLSAVVPISGSGVWDDLSEQLWPGLTAEQRTLYIHKVTPDYFKTMGTPLLRGRDFSPSDQDTAILNDAAARTYFPGRDPVGLNFRTDEKHSYRVIGIAGNARYLDLRVSAPRTIYLMAARSRELADNPEMSGTTWNVLVRANGDTRPVLEAVRGLVRNTGKDVVITRAMPFDQLVDDALKIERLVALLAGAFAIIAALLAAIGLYGVLAYTTARRTSEIGVRIALGASRGNVLWMILRRALLVAFAGTAVGIPAALICGRTIASMLYGISAADSGTIVLAAVFMLSVTALAGLVPAWRASRVDPMSALRWE